MARSVLSKNILPRILCQKLQGLYSNISHHKKFSILKQFLTGIDLVPKAGFIHRTYEDITREGNVKMMPSGTAESRRFAIFVSSSEQIFLHLQFGICRYVLKKDGRSYSFHWTIISKDSSMYIHYKNHQESVMCVEGEAEVEVSIIFCLLLFPVSLP